MQFISGDLEGGKKSEFQGFLFVFQVHKTHSPRMCKRCITHPGTIPTWNSSLPTPPQKENVQAGAEAEQGELAAPAAPGAQRWLQWVLSAAGPWQEPHQELQRPSKKQLLEQAQAVLCDG